MKSIIEHYQARPLGEERCYAVCLPLIWQEGRWQVLYEIRSQHVSQPGEVSFPGGRVEEGETYQQAAIRETVEELNIEPEQVHVWGEIDYLVQPTRSIHCFVAELVIDDWRRLRVNEEVDSLFTVSLEKFMAQAPTVYPLQMQSIISSDFPLDRIPSGEQYRFRNMQGQILFYEHLEKPIWGITAQLTNRFIEIVTEARQHDDLLKNEC
ncbi:TPA: CoA pyrophosphatase [Streptococcus equi subsp. zooepidemicus]|nr:CoA pyrophosphatase [Streptococcus equi subsp. zooepidemicus]